MATPLKAGRYEDYADSMAAAIETKMEDELSKADGKELSAYDNRMILFKAIARGVLWYLQDHLAELETTLRKDTTSGHKHTLNFTVIDP